MRELESLRPGQRAILRALAEPRSSYGDVATRLDTTPDAVRRVAREALEDIAGRPEALDEEVRRLLTDFALGQATPGERSAALARLERSDAARGWITRAFAGLPPALRRATVPALRADEAPAERTGSGPADGEGSGRGAGERDGWVRRAGDGSRRDGSGSRRRDLLLGGALACLGLLGGSVLGSKALLGGGAEPPRERRASTPAAPLRVERQLRLVPPAGGAGAGIAVVSARGEVRELLVQARLPRRAAGRIFELRLSRGAGASRSLGSARTDARGNLRAARPLPADWRRFAALDVALVGAGDAVPALRAGPLSPVA